MLYRDAQTDGVMAEAFRIAGIVALGGVLCALAGCGDHCARVRQRLMSDGPVPVAEGSATQSKDEYRVGCPDLLEVAVDGRMSDPNGTFEVQANGCIDLGPLGGVRVERQTPREIEAEIARVGRLRRERVHVRVAKFRSQHVYLVGQVRGEQRAVPYQGPETVVDLLRRTGGVTAEGAPSEITITRQPGLSGQKPEVIHVDLRQVLLDGNPRSNVVVQPYDQIDVPENKRSRLSKALHPWLRRLGRLFHRDA